MIVLNVQGLTQDDSDTQECLCVSDQLPQYHMHILLGTFDASVGRVNIFKLTIGKNSLPTGTLLTKTIFQLKHNGG
jgi:hypothetical protein